MTALFYFHASGTDVPHRSSMPFKYSSHIGGLRDCPPSSCQPRTVTAYRFVFPDPSHPKYRNNFLPVSIKDPTRLDINDPDEKKCDMYGLSFFDSEANARRRFEHFLRDRPKLRDTLGTHIAEGTIEPPDGVVTRTDRKGHFTLHESDVADLQPKFTAVTVL